MSIKNYTWLTIKYKEDAFDVKLSNGSHVICEIRSVDSEVNIASLLSSEAKREIQEIIINKGTHHAL
jgi:small nuclear ribonucleoprotein (snRNP)-like protein